MSREEIIRKGEEQLNYIMELAIQGYKNAVTMGIAQLDMLNYLLDEEYEKYEQWFTAFADCE